MEKANLIGKILTYLVFIIIGFLLATFQPNNNIQNQNLDPDEILIIDTVKKSLPAVVTVVADDQNIGSGFVVSSDGLIITSKHVVDDITPIYQVITNSNIKHNVEQVYRDPNNDLALLKVSALGLSPLSLGNSSDIQLGQTALAIGTPLGEFQNTVTVGIVSGVDRQIIARSPVSGTLETLSNLIQTDAPISSGNSGGPLLNTKGEVIGVNTAVSLLGENIGFAIPVNSVKDLVNSVK